MGPSHQYISSTTAEGDPSFNGKGVCPFKRGVQQPSRGEVISNRGVFNCPEEGSGDPRKIFCLTVKEIYL